MTRPIRFTFGLALVSAAAAAQQYVISTFAGGGAATMPSMAVDAAIGTPMGVTTDAAGDVYFASPNLNSVFKRSQNGVLTRVAGNSRLGYSGDGGPATSARLSAPASVAFDGAGNLFIADTGNGRIRRVSRDGVIVTVAGTGVCCFSGDRGPATSAQLSVSAIAADNVGNLFIAGGSLVRKVSPSGIITTVAGTGACCFAGDDGPAINAALVAVGVAVDRSGNLFIADSIHVRKVSPDGIISTVAGNGTEGFSGDGGPATSAPLRAWGVAVDDAGSLLIANLCSIRKVTTDGIITTVAGTCTGGGPFSGDGGPAASAHLSGAFGVALDGAGKLFIADASNYRIRQVSLGGIITTVAGNGAGESFGVGSGDGGPATGVQLGYPSSVAVDSVGNVIITDSNRIRRVAPDGIIATVAGNGTPGFSGDGGPAINAQLQGPAALTLDGAGNLFFADSGTRVRKVSATGIITTVAGNGIGWLPRGLPVVDGGPATSTALSGFVRGVAVDQAGNLFIADYDRIRKVSPEGAINTVAGGGTNLGEGGPATEAQLYPWGVLVDGGGNLLIADEGYRRIRKVSRAGIITTVAGSGAFSGPSGDGGRATSARLSAPVGLALDSAGNLFVADPGSDFLTGGETGLLPCCDHRIRKISPDGMITTVAGIGVPGFSGDGGPASTAALNGPLGVSVDGAGNVYVADSANAVVRLLRPTGRSLLIGAVVDAASQRADPVSPGKIVVIYGAGVGPAQLVQSSGGAPGTKLSGTTVSFNGIAAPILYTSATQIAVVVPYYITGTTAQAMVTYQGQASNELTVTVAVSAPSLFTVNQQGWGQVAAINTVDGTVNTAANPVRVGGYISLFATGEGQTSPPGVDGRLGGSTPAHPVLPVSVTVGGIPAMIQYQGSVQGQVAGLMQVNVQIPAGVQPGGYVPVVLKVGDAPTSGAVWIAASGN